MIVIGYQILQGYAQFWPLAAACQSLLGPADSLMAMGEGPLGSLLSPWSEFSQQDWTQGRIFGLKGELRWRSYGPLVRAVLLVDVAAADVEQRLVDLAALAFEDVQKVELTPRDATTKVYLWRIDPYGRATFRVYLDGSGQERFARYVQVRKEAQ